MIARIYTGASVAALGSFANRSAIADAAGGRHAMWAPLARSEPGFAMDVWEDNGEVRGFVSLGRTPGDGTVGHLFALYVEPSAWGAGIGSGLLERGIEQFRAHGISKAELWVQDENLRARSFYERRGWDATDDMAENDRGRFVRYTIAL